MINNPDATAEDTADDMPPEIVDFLRYCEVDPKEVGKDWLDIMCRVVFDDMP